MTKECDKAIPGATAYSSPPCYAHEFPGWFGECDAPAEPESPADQGARPTDTVAAKDLPADHPASASAPGGTF
jgi:hypothetical protein